MDKMSSAHVYLRLRAVSVLFMRIIYSRMLLNIAAHFRDIFITD